MNVNDHNNKGLLAIKLRKALKAKALVNKDVEKNTGLAKSTVSAILRGEDMYSLDSYKKVAKYLGVEIKPEISLVTKTDLLEKEKEIWMAGIAERTAREAGLLKGAQFKRQVLTPDLPVPKRDYVTELPAPVVQYEFTKWQAWVIMALQVVVIIFLVFPVK